MFLRKNRDTGKDSKEALYLAHKHLEEIQARGPEVSEVVASTIAIRKQNHFAEQLTALMKGGHPA